MFSLVAHWEDAANNAHWTSINLSHYFFHLHKAMKLSTQKANGVTDKGKSPRFCKQRPVPCKRLPSLTNNVQECIQKIHY